MVVPNTQVNLPISSTSTQVVSEVLSKMLNVGIIDPGKFAGFLFPLQRKCSI